MSKSGLVWDELGMLMRMLGLRFRSWLPPADYPKSPAARDKSLWCPRKIGRKSAREFSTNYILMPLKHRMVSQDSVTEGRFVLFYCNSNVVFLIDQFRLERF